jgi:hypothetical protein
MTKAELYTFVTQLLDGYLMDTGLFDTFLDTSQMKFENMRPWVILRAEDATQTASSSDIFTTSKALPTDFRKWYGRAPIVLADSNNNSILYYQEIPLSSKLGYKSAGGKFYADYASKLLYLCGQLTQSYTIHQFYIKKSTLISADDANSWIFPEEYHKILGLDIVNMWKLGVDYDLFGQQQGNNLALQGQAIYNEMSRWDSDLQNSMTNGVDPFSNGNGGWQAGQLPGEYMN